jgi:hypothetical protein
MPAFHATKPGLEMPEVANARTELQMVAAMPAPVVAITQAVPVAEGQRPEAAGGSAGRKRWPLVGGVVGALALAGGAGWYETRPGVTADNVHVAGGPAQHDPAATAPEPPGRAVVTPSAGSSGATAAAPQPSSASSGPAATPSTPTSVSGHEVGHRPSVASAPGHAASTEAPPARATPTTTPVVAEARPAAEPPTAPEPAPLPAAPVAAPAPAPPTPPAAPAFDIGTASVAIGAPTHLVATGAAKVAATIGHLRAAMTQCYRSGLPALASPLEGTGTLHIETEDDGIISKATVSGPVRGSVASCIEGKVIGQRVEVDTGAASADVPLEFKAR